MAALMKLRSNAIVRNTMEIYHRIATKEPGQIDFIHMHRHRNHMILLCRFPSGAARKFKSSVNSYLQRSGFVSDEKQMIRKSGCTESVTKMDGCGDVYLAVKVPYVDNAGYELRSKMIEEIFSAIKLCYRIGRYIGDFDTRLTALVRIVQHIGKKAEKAAPRAVLVSVIEYVGPY